MIRACVVQIVLTFAVFHWLVTPAIERWRWLTVPATLLVLYAFWWSHRYSSRWQRHLQWSDAYTRADALGDTITMLGLLASPDVERPKPWPAFWWRWWRIEL